MMKIIVLIILLIIKIILTWLLIVLLILHMHIILLLLKLFLLCKESYYLSYFSSLQTQYHEDPIFLDALLKIIGAVNRGFQKSIDSITIASDILQNGKSIVEKFMSFPMGQQVLSDQYTLDFIFSFLWVFKKDTTCLVAVIRYLMNIVNSVPSFYKYFLPFLFFLL